MATPNFGFQTISDSQSIDIVNAVNTPVTQIDTTLSGIAPLDSTPTSGSTKGVTSGGVYEAVHALTDFIVFGDSWSTLTNALYTGTCWTTQIANRTGLTEHNYAVNGAGFVHGTTIATQFATAQADTSYDHSRVKYVFVVCGINDVANNETVSGSDVQPLFTNIRTEFPNAKYLYALNRPVNFNTSYSTFASKIRDFVLNGGFTFLNSFGLYAWGYNAIFTDGTHFNNYGNQQFATYMLAEGNTQFPQIINIQQSSTTPSNVRLAKSAHGVALWSNGSGSLNASPGVQGINVSYNFSAALPTGLVCGVFFAANSADSSVITDHTIYLGAGTSDFNKTFIFGNLGNNPSIALHYIYFNAYVPFNDL